MCVFDVQWCCVADAALCEVCVCVHVFGYGYVCFMCIRPWWCSVNAVPGEVLVCVRAHQVHQAAVLCRGCGAM